MKYFIRGSAHFFNLFANFLEYCQNIIYFIFILIVLFLIIYTFSKTKQSLKNFCRSYLSLFKFIAFILTFILLFITSFLTYKINNQFYILSLLVVSINFLKETFNIYDNKIFYKSNKKIFILSDFSRIILPNLFLIFFKITYWAELYVFNFNEIRNYFICMLMITVIQIMIMIFSKIYSIYNKVFQFLEFKNDYKKFNKIIDLLKILIISDNNINYFRITRIYLQREIINNKNRKNIICFCYFYKSILAELKNVDMDNDNIKIYKEFSDIKIRLGSDLNEQN